VAISEVSRGEGEPQPQGKKDMDRRPPDVYALTMTAGPVQSKSKQKERGMADRATLPQATAMSYLASCRAHGLQGPSSVGGSSHACQRRCLPAPLPPLCHAQSDYVTPDAAAAAAGVLALLRLSLGVLG
jgi:hypothetical protein